MDHYFFNAPHIVNLRSTTAQTVETKIDKAIEQMQIGTSDSYDNISVLSIYWGSDDTGGAEDSSLFIQTLSKLPNVQTCQQSLSDDANAVQLGTEIFRVKPQSGSRKLFIFHYAGHATACSTPNKFIITPKSGQKLDSRLNMPYIKEGLKNMCLTTSGLDVLLVMDSSCAAIAGRERKVKGARMEMMVATARKGIKGGQSLTQHWCEAFSKLLEIGKPFTCDDIIKEITPNSGLEQTFILREGWDLPITFRLRPGPIETTLPAAVTSRTVVTVFHVKENPNSPHLKQLIDYLHNAPIPITVLGVLPTSSTLLLLRIPVFLEELLVLPRASLILIDS